MDEHRHAAGHRHLKMPCPASVEERKDARQRLEPAVRGLELAVAGATIAERESQGAKVFLGYSTEKHWLLV